MIVRTTGRRAFTLVEVLVALTIMSLAFAIIWGAFSATTRGWRRGGEMLEKLHHGDFAIEQIESALRSAAYPANSGSKCGFWLSSDGGAGYPRQRMCWVTSSPAFIPADQSVGRGLHRLELAIGETAGGHPALSARAWPYLQQEQGSGDTPVEPWIVSPEIKGLQCRVWDFQREEWREEWEDTNRIPALVEITLFLDPVEEYGEPVRLQRLVELPMAEGQLAGGGTVPTTNPTNTPAGSLPGIVQPPPGVIGQPQPRPGPGITPGTPGHIPIWRVERPSRR